MADMGFLPAVRRLLDQTAPDRQTVLFSATLDGDVATLTREYQQDPVLHEVGEATPDVRSAVHRFYVVERMERNPVVADVVNAAWPSIVFTRTRHGADRLAKQLGKLGFEAAPIHGGRSQSQRNRALDAFTRGRVHALVATDVAARGIHVDGVASVIHYDPPEDHKAYVHRSGRTARAGAGGLVVSLVQPDQRKAYRRMQRDVGLDEPIVAHESSGRPLEITSASVPAERVDGERRHRSASAERDREVTTDDRGRRDSSNRPRGGKGSGSARRRDDRGGSFESRGGRGAGPDGRRRNDRPGSFEARGEKGSGPDGRRNDDRSGSSEPRSGTGSGRGGRRSDHGGSSEPRGGAGSGRGGRRTPPPNNRKARRAHLQPER
jgi:superfamily II DNA/RNA helicase